MLALALLATTLGGLVGGQAAGAVAPQPHPGLVPETPATGYPVILMTPTITSTLRRQVKAVDQAGRAIISGGDFTQIRLQNGTVIDQSYFAAWSIDTKAMICQGKFTFNGEILAIEPGPTASKVYVGGTFTRVTGADGIERARGKVVLLDLATCTVDTTFVSQGANGKVDEIVLVGSRLFLGGDFTNIGGRAIETVAELDAAKGTVNPAFSFPTTGELASRIRGMEANPAGTRLIFGGRFGTITGNGRSIPAPTAVIDITDPAAPVLTAHRSSGYATLADLQDVAVAPDGGSVGLVFGTATVSDYIYLTETTEQTVSYKWRHFMRDSSFGVAISNNAMYVSGHFCKPDAGPGPSDLMAPKMGLGTCTGSGVKYTGGVWRTHLAAFSLTDGTPLPWNPGQASWTGGRAITVTSRGLLVGYDGERTNDLVVGATAFFDLGAQVEDLAPPSDVTFTAPAAGTTVNNPARVSGTATDDAGVVSYGLSLQASDGRWLRANGTLGTTPVELTVPAAGDGSFQIDLTMPAGTYTAHAVAFDTTGRRSANTTSVSFTQSGVEGVKPVTTVNAPTASVPSETAVTITGVATDNVAVQSVIARVRSANGRYLRADGTLSTTAVDYPLTVTAGALGSPSVSWQAALGDRLPVGTYTLELALADSSGNAGSGTATVVITAVAPVPTITSPTGTVTFGQAATVGATVTDNAGVSDVRLQITSADGAYLQPNGSFAATATDLPATVTGLGTTNAAITYSAGVLPQGTYTASVIATDVVGTSATATRTFPVAIAAAASVPAITAYSGFSRSDGNYTVGSMFQVSVPTQVSAIGIFDSDGNGVLDNSNDAGAAIWRQSDRAVLAQVVVPRGTPVTDRWAYASLPTAITLQPGVTYVVGHQSFRRGESFADRGTFTTDPRVTVTGRAYISGSSLAYPSTQSSGVGYGIPNLRLVSSAAPTLLPLADRTDPTLTAVAAQFAGADPDGGTVTYSSTPLPDGLTLNPATGAVTGTPVTVGAVLVTVTATDDEGQTATASFTWTITDGTPPPPCTVTAVDGGVRVDWLPVAGVSTFQILSNAKWVAAVSNGDLFYVHVGGTLDNRYVVRYRLAGGITDLSCPPA